MTNGIFEPSTRLINLFAIFWDLWVYQTFLLAIIRIAIRQPWEEALSDAFTGLAFIAFGYLIYLYSLGPNVLATGHSSWARPYWHISDSIWHNYVLPRPRSEISKEFKYPSKKYMLWVIVKNADSVKLKELNSVQIAVHLLLHELHKLSSNECFGWSGGGQHYGMLAWEYLSSVLHY